MGHLPITPFDAGGECPWMGCPNTADHQLHDPHADKTIWGCRFHLTAYRRHLEAHYRHPSH